MSDIETRLKAAIEDHRHGRLEQAREGYEAVLAAEPKHVHALGVSAILVFQMGDAEGAVARLQSAIALEPENPALLNNLGNIHRKTDQVEDALEAYRAALRIDPGHVESICNLGVLVRNAGEMEDAMAIFHEALALDPGHVETNHNLGVTLVMQSRPEEAADRFERCYAEGRVPVVDPSWHAQTLAHLGRRERAIEILEAHAAARPDDPVVRHYVAAIRGEAPERASDGYVREHFDQFAENFDETLTRLDYRAPEIVGDLVMRLCDGTRVKFLYDFGCGTGRAGPLVRDAAKILIGIDLSPRMLDRARKRGVYDELILAEFTAALGEIEPASIDMAVSVDTLIYFGDLAPIFAGLRRTLTPGGAFVGTVESHADDDPAGGAKITLSGRYSHSRAHIHETTAAAGLVVHAVNPFVIRKEHANPVEGFVFLIENPA